MRTITREGPRGRMAACLALLAGLALAAGCDTTTSGGNGKKVDAAPRSDAAGPGRDATSPGGDGTTPARDTGGPAIDSAPVYKDAAVKKDTGSATCGKAGPGEIGAACTKAADCTKTPGMPFCQGGFWKGGYCLDGSGGSSSNCDLTKPLTSCKAPCTVCTKLNNFFPAARCARRCTTGADCRAGYACKDTIPKSAYKWCSPPF